MHFVEIIMPIWFLEVLPGCMIAGPFLWTVRSQPVAEYIKSGEVVVIWWYSLPGLLASLIESWLPKVWLLKPIWDCKPSMRWESHIMNWRTWPTVGVRCANTVVSNAPSSLASLDLDYYYVANFLPASVIPEEIYPISDLQFGFAVHRRSFFRILIHAWVGATSYDGPFSYNRNGYKEAPLPGASIAIQVPSRQRLTWRWSMGEADARDTTEIREETAEELHKLFAEEKLGWQGYMFYHWLACYHSSWHLFIGTSNGSNFLTRRPSRPKYSIRRHLHIPLVLSFTKNYALFLHSSRISTWAFTKNEPCFNWYAMETISQSLGNWAYCGLQLGGCANGEARYHSPTWLPIQWRDATRSITNGKVDG